MSSSLASAIRQLLPKQLPPSLTNRPGNLYEVLSRYPKDGVGQRVHKIRWTSKGIPNCYWEVTRTSLKLEGKHGKAWGILTWKGKVVSEREEKIPGSLKFSWAEGTSRIPPGFTSRPKLSS
ncbi:uncharacterized protein LAESUDRAFT_689803 [Laetiporus sulphureus 93-53]|uniref:Uncharacterized protein n=1 Tax=Laetiporus sulphureus 93-53 TaxID=1314785 RepID=A0A165IC51_9APHY|nr:uncharacterized protein LAESUDRAFT_689803 [Laetiporus sulphureus 93-53]KZT12877.1 hypothetical protein LAESUDRAFT_689803 [Laetiporus sulphureus 93-53]